jgi:peptidoglycan/xylan/chitin deacetylase (PgdA/CDA1 family)
MKKLIKEAIGFVLVKWFFLTGKKPDDVLSITFHKPTVKLFTDVIDQLENLGYLIIDLGKLESILKVSSIDQKVAFITMDDGWKNNLELLHVIENRNVPVAIFITTEPVQSGNYWWEFARVGNQSELTGLPDVQAFKRIPDEERVLKISLIKQKIRLERSCVNMDELKQLANNRWVTIGSHSVTHPILKYCSTEQQEIELQKSKQQLTEWTGKRVAYFAYPNGDYNRETIDIIRNSGYSLSFTDSHGKISLPWNDPYEIPRNSLNDDGGYYENYSKLLGIWQKVCGEN